MTPPNRLHCIICYQSVVTLVSRQWNRVTGALQTVYLLTARSAPDILILTDRSTPVSLCLTDQSTPGSLILTDLSQVIDTLEPDNSSRRSAFFNKKSLATLVSRQWNWSAPEVYILTVRSAPDSQNETGRSALVGQNKTVRSQLIAPGGLIFLQKVTGYSR